MELIRDGDEYIKDIALKVGIDDQFYFSRIFKILWYKSPAYIKNLIMQLGKVVNQCGVGFA